jgi:toxin YoeB
MRLVFTPLGWEDYCHWHDKDKSTLKRVIRLLEDVIRHPTEGIGKPEPLRHVLDGCWSRRIDEEHRLIYLVENEGVVILQARFRYRS